MLLYCAAAIIVWSVAIPIWISAVITLVLMLNLRITLRAHAFRNSAGAIRGLSVNRSSLFVHLKNGSTVGVEYIRSAVLHPAVIAMKLRLEGTSKSVYLLIPFDALPTDEFRQLRMRLGRLVQPTGMLSD